MQRLCVTIFTLALLCSIEAHRHTKDQKRGIVAKKDKFEIAFQSGTGTSSLPLLGQLLTSKATNGTTYTYEGCEIILTRGSGTIELNLKSRKCQDVMSVPRLYSKLTSSTFNSSIHFLPMKKFNVEDVTFNRDTKLVVISCEAKESFVLFRGTNAKVTTSQLSISFTHDEEQPLPFESLTFRLSGEMPVNSETTMKLSLVKPKSVSIADFSLDGDFVKLKAFYELFSQVNQRRRRDEDDGVEEGDGGSFPAMFEDVTLSKPKITGIRDSKGNSELVVSGTGNPTQTRTTCEAYVDIGFVVDSSGSVWKDFEKEKHFVKSLAKGFRIDKKGIRAGVITFSNKANIDIRLDDFHDTDSFTSAVDDITLISSSTNIDKALKLTDKQFFTQKNGARDGIPKLVILITDGEQTVKKAEDPAEIASEMQKRGMKLVIIGVGRKINKTELVRIAGDGNTYTADSYEELADDQFLDTVTKAVCSQMTTGTPIDTAFSYISVLRSPPSTSQTYNITIKLENGTTSMGEITESGLIHRGYIIFPDEKRHNFWYYSLESSIYWEADKGATENIWKGRTKSSEDDALSYSNGIPAALAGLEQSFFNIIVQVAPGKPAEYAILAKFDQVKPAVLVGKMTKKDVGNVPIIDEVTVDTLVEYANADIGAVTDEGVAKMIKQFSSSTGIEEGTKLKIRAPFKKLLERISIEDTSAIADPYMRIMIEEGNELSYEFPDSKPMNLQQVLLILGVKPTFKNVFSSKIDVIISRFVINLLLQVIEVTLDTTDGVVLGKNVVSLEKAVVSLKRIQNGAWIVHMTSEMIVDGAVMKVEVSETDERYSLVGVISQVNTLDIVEHFNVSSSGVEVMKSIEAFDITLLSCQLITNFTGTTQPIRITGRATFLRWSTYFEGYIVKNDADENVLTYGIVIPSCSINDLASEMFTSGGKQIELIKADWLSRLSISMIVGMGRKISFQHSQLKEMYSADSKPLKYYTDGKEGASVFATVVVPDDCRNETICQLVKQTVNSGFRLELRGSVTSGNISLEASLPKDVKVSEIFHLKGATLRVSVGDATEFSIVGSAEVTFVVKKVWFNARVKQEASGKFKLTFTMSGLWQNPFNIRNVQFGNFQLSVGMEFITLEQPYVLSGELHFGYPGTALKSELFGALEGNEGFYFYSKFAQVSVKDLFDAFNVQTVLPRQVQDIQFPDGLIAGISSPKGQRIEVMNVDLRSSFLLQGACVVLGINMFCDVSVDLPSTFHLVGQFPKMKIAGGAVELSGVDQQSGPKVEVVLGNGTSSVFVMKIDAYVEVLKIGGGVRILVSQEGLHFQLVGRFLDLFQARVSISAPYGSLLTMQPAKWKVSSCISDSVKERITDGAIFTVVESTNATTFAQEQNDKMKEKSSSWFSKVMKKVTYWKNKLTEKERQFQEEIQKIEKSKKDLEQSCVAKCDKRKVWVGGFGVKTCVIAGRNVQCPYWIPQKTMRDDPLCLADCEAGRWKLFSKIRSFFQSGDLMIMEEKMQFYSKMLEKIQSFVVSAKGLIENAELASQKVGEMVALAGDALKALKNYTIKNLFYLHHLCISATLEHAGKGLCFEIDTEFYLGGKNGKQFMFKEEACFNVNWVVEIGKLIARKAFPGIETIKEKIKQTKELFSRSEKQEEDVEGGSKDLERRDTCEGKGKRERRCKEVSIHKKLIHYRSQEVYDSLPDLVLKNDQSMQAFRDLFDNDPDQVTRSTDTDRDVMVNGKLIDSLALETSHEGENSCRRAHGVVNKYAGVLESINFLMAKNNDVRKSYEKFIKQYLNTFDTLEWKVRNESIGTGMRPSDLDNALFYVSKAKQGIAHWKVNYNIEFDKLDRASLQHWRGFMKDLIADKKLNIDSYMEVTGNGSKRVSIPNVTKEQITRSFNIAQQVVRNLLQDDQETFSSKTPSLRLLVDEVNNMKDLKEKLNCI